MRSRYLRVLLVFLLAAIAAVVAPSAAGAHGLPSRSALAPCPNAPAYPPSAKATIEASTTAPNIGETIEASGFGYCFNESVAITIDGKNVGTAHTDGTGKFDPAVVVPGPAGQKQLCGIGASGLATDRDCLTLTVKGTGGSNNGSPSNKPGSTAFTGLNIALLILAAAVLIGAGVMLNLRSRTRRAHSRS